MDDNQVVRLIAQYLHERDLRQSLAALQSETYVNIESAQATFDIFIS